MGEKKTAKYIFQKQLNKHIKFIHIIRHKKTLRTEAIGSIIIETDT